MCLFILHGETNIYVHKFLHSKINYKGQEVYYTYAILWIKCSYLLLHYISYITGLEQIIMSLKNNKNYINIINFINIQIDDQAWIQGERISGSLIRII